jgi:hypothetical protein
MVRILNRIAPLWHNFRYWVEKRKEDLLLYVIIVPLLQWLSGILAQHFVQPGLARDIGFYVVLITLILASAFIITKRNAKVTPRPHTQPTNTITDDQKQQFQQRILVFRAEAYPNFQGVDPYVLFHFWIFNGSPFSVYIKKDITGHVKFTDQVLSGNIELMSDPSSVTPGGSFRFTIRQWITKEGAKRITGMTNDETRSEFSFDTVFLNIASRDPALENIERRLDLPTLSNVRKPWEIRWS